MRIAQVAPLYESVPPRYYGGTERIVSYLTERLVRDGHEVTLFASGDSATSARLVAPCARSLRLDPECRDQLVHHILMLEQVLQRAAEFDIIHFHIDYLHFPASRRGRWSQLTTLHGRLDLPDLAGLYREFVEMPLVSISDAQRAALPEANWLGTVHHGLPPGLYPFRERAGKYLAFLGRISPEKRCDRAIEIARRAELDLKIAAKVDPADREYFRSVVRPLLSRKGVEYVGEIAEAEKPEFLGNAYALLFPIDWPEPFGLVMIEALACGTPVVAWRNGSVPEVVEHGVTGFVGESVAELAEGVRAAGGLSRRRCRRAFEERFTDALMTRNYLRLYERLRGGGPRPAHRWEGRLRARGVNGAPRPRRKASWRR